MKKPASAAAAAVASKVEYSVLSLNSQCCRHRQASPEDGLRDVRDVFFYLFQQTKLITMIINRQPMNASVRFVKLFCEKEDSLYFVNKYIVTQDKQTSSMFKLKNNL